MSLQRTSTCASVMNPEIIQHYHAHVYYDPVASRDRAARLREHVAAAFPGVTLGRWHDTPVGPHPQSMYQLCFPALIVGLIFAVADAQSRRSEHFAPPRHRRRLRRSYRPRRLVGQRAAAAGGRSAQVAQDAVIFLKICAVLRNAYRSGPQAIADETAMSYADGE